MAARLPPYFDALIAARRAGQTGRDVHLGFWDDPSAPAEPGEFGAAQARLTERVVDRIPLRDGESIVDIACGFGGTLAVIDARWRGLSLTGINIDARQLQLCAGAVTRPDNSLTLVAGDACALPFPNARFDHAFCVEAMFHFPSRQIFLAEAARILRPGGYLAVTDILMRPPGSRAPWDNDTIAAIVRRDYGPWPELWIEPATIVSAGARAGLTLEAGENWSGPTWPGYRTIAPPRPGHPVAAGDVFRWMHGNGYLTYAMMLFRRP